MDRAKPNEFVIQGPRQSGKTYTIMTEIYDLILEGKGHDVLVVFPERSYIHWWTRMWNDRFPHVPMVEYTTAHNMLKLRGRFYKHIYVEDVNLAGDEGIYAEQWVYLEMSARDGSITFTARPEPLNQRSHSVTHHTSWDVIKRLKSKK